MKTLQFAALALALGSSTGMAGDCSGPQAPSLPDGATASMEDMLAGQKAIKAYQAANLEYMGCLEKEFTAAEAAVLESSSEDDKKAAQTTYQEAVDAYNAAVSQEEEIAGQFNTEIREYKAANPG